MSNINTLFFCYFSFFFFGGGGGGGAAISSWSFNVTIERLLSFKTIKVYTAICTSLGYDSWQVRNFETPLKLHSILKGSF